jgi:uncharacterized protein (DUF488 family)
VSGQGPVELLSIGHSNHAIERFIALLKGAGVTAIADVRSVPASRFNPQFNGRRLEAALASAGVGYAWLGTALGGRPDDPALIVDGTPDYVAIAARPAFAEGLERLEAMAARTKTAMMCAERDPAHCHRALLVAPALVKRGHDVAHLHADGRIEGHSALETRLREGLGPQGELFGAGSRHRPGRSTRA